MCPTSNFKLKNRDNYVHGQKRYNGHKRYIYPIFIFFLRGDAYLEQSKQCASLGFFSRKTVTLLLITICLLLRVHLKDSSVFFALKNIKRFESYKR